jgi:DNA (cytosine-5)-methyltransferase 1
MFSGIGGFEVGIEEAFGYMGTKSANPESRQAEPEIQFGGEWSTMEEKRGVCLAEPGWRRAVCIGYSEIDKYASAIYRGHFPEHKNFGDATKLNPRELPDFDLLVGGFPCQAFSIAGKRAGFMDARGTLFFEIARVLEHKRPRYFLLENVEGLLSHDDRKTIVAIIGVLSDLGYRVSWQVLNTKDYGLPQNRERIFIAGRFGGECGPEVFPVWQGDGGDSSEIREWSVVRGRGKNTSGCLDTRGVNAFDRADMDKLIFEPLIRIENKSGEAFYREDAGTIRANASRNYQTVQIADYQGDKGFRIRQDGICPTLVAHGSGGPGINNIPSVLTETANAVTSGGYLQKGERELIDGKPSKEPTPEWKRRIRRLTPMECERLQGFPDRWTEWGIDEGGGRVEISDTQRYKCLGNAVSTNVIARIISRWKELQED